MAGDFDVSDDDFHVIVKDEFAPETDGDGYIPLPIADDIALSRVAVGAEREDIIKTRQAVPATVVLETLGDPEE